MEELKKQIILMESVIRQKDCEIANLKNEIAVLHLLPEGGVDLNKMIRDLTRAMITHALSRTRNNKNKASKLLGLKRTTLLVRMQSFGMPLNQAPRRCLIQNF